MYTSILKIVGEVAGLAGLAIGLVIIIFKEVIRKNIFPQLPVTEGYKILRMILILTWSTAIVGIGAWALVSIAKPNDISPATFEPAEGPSGDATSKATPAALDRELQVSSSEQIKEARDHFAAGNQNLAAGRYQEAAKDYQTSCASVPTMSSYLNLGLALRYRSAFGEALTAFKTGLGLAQRHKERRFEARFLANLGIASLELNQQSDALNYSDQAYAVAVGIPDLTVQAIALNNKGIIYRLQGKLEPAIDAFESALTKAGKVPDLRIETDANANLGVAYYGKRDFDRALQYADKALSLADRTQNFTTETQMYSLTGALYIAKGQLGEAEQRARSSISLARKIQNPQYEANALQSLAQVSLLRGEDDDALAGFQHALKIYHDRGDGQDEISALINFTAVQNRTVFSVGLLKAKA